MERKTTFILLYTPCKVIRKKLYAVMRLLWAKEAIKPTDIFCEMRPGYGEKCLPRPL